MARPLLPDSFVRLARPISVPVFLSLSFSSWSWCLVCLKAFGWHWLSAHGERRQTGIDWTAARTPREQKKKEKRTVKDNMCGERASE